MKRLQRKQIKIDKPKHIRAIARKETGGIEKIYK